MRAISLTQREKRHRCLLSRLENVQQQRVSKSDKYANLCHLK